MRRLLARDFIKAVMGKQQSQLSPEENMANAIARGVSAAIMSQGRRGSAFGATTQARKDVFDNTSENVIKDLKGIKDNIGELVDLIKKGHALDVKTARERTSAFRKIGNGVKPSPATGGGGLASGLWDRLSVLEEVLIGTTLSRAGVAALRKGGIKGVLSSAGAYGRGALAGAGRFALRAAPFVAAPVMAYYGSRNIYRSRNESFFGNKAGEGGILGGRAAGYLSNTAAGALMGARMGGPWGALIGGILGVTGSVLIDKGPQISQWLSKQWNFWSNSKTFKSLKKTAEVTGQAFLKGVTLMGTGLEKLWTKSGLDAALGRAGTAVSSYLDGLTLRVGKWVDELPTAEQIDKYLSDPKRTIGDMAGDAVKSVLREMDNKGKEQLNKILPKSMQMQQGSKSDWHLGSKFNWWTGTSYEETPSGGKKFYTPFGGDFYTNPKDDPRNSPGAQTGMKGWATGGIMNQGTIVALTKNGPQVMAEKGPEAVMPLANTKDGSLGVKAIMPQMSVQNLVIASPKNVDIAGSRSTTVDTNIGSISSGSGFTRRASSPRARELSDARTAGFATNVLNSIAPGVTGFDTNKIGHSLAQQALGGKNLSQDDFLTKVTTGGLGSLYGFGGGFSNNTVKAAGSANPFAGPMTDTERADSGGEISDSQFNRMLQDEAQGKDISKIYSPKIIQAFYKKKRKVKKGSQAVSSFMQSISSGSSFGSYGAMMGGAMGGMIGGMGGAMTGFSMGGGMGSMGGGFGGGGGGGSGSSSGTSTPAFSPNDAQTSALSQLEKNGTFAVGSKGSNPFAGISPDQLKSIGVSVKRTDRDGSMSYSYTKPDGKAVDTSNLKGLKLYQQQAYTALRNEGLSDSGARAAVATVTGEALSKPGDVHADPSRRNPNQQAHGIASWDDERSARIAKQFGKMPQDMTVAEQSKALAWEMKNFYPKTWASMNDPNVNVNDKVGAMVSGFERPANPVGETSKRIDHLNNLTVQDGPQSLTSKFTDLGNKSGWGSSTPTQTAAGATGAKGRYDTAYYENILNQYDTHPDRKGSVSNMSPEMKARMGALFRDAPPSVQKELRLVSAFRDQGLQNQLYANSGGSGMVAKNSQHGKGNAVDLGGYGGSAGAAWSNLSPATKKWVGANAAKYGLYRPLQPGLVKGHYEDWHFEPIGNRGDWKSQPNQPKADMSAWQDPGYVPPTNVASAKASAPETPKEANPSLTQASWRNSNNRDGQGSSDQKINVTTPAPKNTDASLRHEYNGIGFINSYMV